MAFVTRHMRCDQVRGRRLEKPEAYSLEYVEDVFGPSTTQMGTHRVPQ